MTDLAQWRLRDRWPSDRVIDRLYRYGVRYLGLSTRHAVRLLHGIRSVTQYAEIRRRAKAAQALDAADDEGARKLISSGHLAFAPGSLPHSSEAVETCQRLVADARANPDNLASPRGYGDAAYFRRIVSGTEFLSHKSLVDFATSEPLVRTVAGYLGEVPWLTSAVLMWTLPNERAESSQLFHFDQKDSKQLKLFLLIEDVAAENGPTAYYDLADSQRLMVTPGFSYRKRLKDEKVFSILPADRLYHMTGAAGSARLLDTCRCLHFGSRGNTKDRFVLILTFNQTSVPRRLGEDEGSGMRPSLTQPLTPLQQAVLRVARA